MDRPSETRLLEGLTYPLDRVGLLKQAEYLDTPSAVVEAIRRLPNVEFQSPKQLQAAIESLP